MKRGLRKTSVRLLVLLAVSFGLAAAGVAAGADDQGKELVGKWEGTFVMPQGGVNVEMTLRNDGGKIVGELKTPHGPWTVTEAKYVDGKWEILVRTSEDTMGRLKGVLSGDKLEGDFMFPPSFGGEFKMTRTKSAK